MTSVTLTAFARTLKGHTGRGKEGLKEINFAKNCLDDVGGVKLGEYLRFNSTLKKINLSDNDFSDETALAINRSLVDHVSIREVDLSKNRISMNALDMIRDSCASNRETKLEARIPKL